MYELQQHLRGLTNEFSRGNFRSAVEHGLAALASDKLVDESTRGVVHRNLSAAYDRLGRRESDRDEHINKAFEIHNGLVEDGDFPTRADLAAALGERVATGTYVGIFALKAAILLDGDGKRAVEAMRGARNDVEEAMQLAPEGDGTSAILNQYETNLSGRWSMSESLYGNANDGLALAARALRLAVSSEKDDRGKGLTGKDILRARARATARGMSAVAVNVFSRIGARTAAEKVALKTL